MRMTPLVCAAVLAALIVPVTASAAADDRDGFGVTPVRLDFTNPGLIRGGGSEGSLRIQNWFSEATEVTVTPQGPMADWITFDPAPPFIVPADSSRPLLVKVAVPENVENGDYSGLLKIRATGTEQPDGSGAAISVEVVPAIKIKVGGEQILRFAAEKVGIQDVNDGSAVALNADVMNRGNVASAPSFHILVKDAAGTTVVDKPVTGDAVAPGSRASQSIPLESALNPGLYTATATLMNAMDGTASFEKLEFRILPQGMIAGSDESQVSGEFVGATVEPRNANVGEIAAVVAQFRNTGPVEIRDAKLTAEIFRDGRRVAVVTSDALRIPAGGMVDLEAFYTPTASGDHVANAYVTYDGFRTPVEEYAFSVAGDGSVDGARNANTNANGGGQDGGSNTPGPALALVVVGIGAVALMRRRK